MLLLVRHDVPTGHPFFLYASISQSQFNTCKRTRIMNHSDDHHLGQLCKINLVSQLIETRYTT